MKKIFLFSLLSIITFSCEERNEISITKLVGSPDYSSAKLSLKDSIKNKVGEYNLSFKVENYVLGMQTLKDFDHKLANSDKGQHIHFIVNNGPYSAHYEENFSKPLDEESNVILAFLSRSYHESIKNKDAFILTQVGDKKIDLDNELLFYSRPKGTYRGDAKDKVLLDFYLVNTQFLQQEIKLGQQFKGRIYN